MNYIFIDARDDFEMVGLVENKRLAEFYIEDKANRKILGNIYRARVEKVVKGMDAAFIDIGREKNSYLHLKQALPKDLMQGRENLTIDKILKEGQEVIVQITKEEVGTKGAKLTSHIELKGRYIVLTPYSPKVNISKKIARQERENLLKKHQKIF